MKWCAFIYSILLLFGCKNTETNRHSVNEKFITEHGNYQFNNFKNYVVFVREWDRNHDPAIMIIDSRVDTGDCSLPFTIIVNHENNNVKKIKGNWADSTGKCGVDTNRMIKLATALSALHAAYVRVDSNDNVFVQTIYGEGAPDLVKFSDPKYITDEYRKKWKEKGNGWHERIEFEVTK